MLLNRRLAATTLLVGVVLFCGIATARTDEGRWSDTLHNQHRSDLYRTALKRLNSQQARGVQLDACTACHERRPWWESLVLERTMVSDTSCGRCHQQPPLQSGATGKNQPATNQLGVRWMGARLRRPAHAGLDYPTGLAALPQKQRVIPCGECHPDHQGEIPADSRSSTLAAPSGSELHRDGIRRLKRLDPVAQPALRMTEVCINCHLPAEPSLEAVRVIKLFLDEHRTEDGLSSPRVGADITGLVDATLSKSQPLSAGDHRRVVQRVREALAQQTMYGQPDPNLTGCTPGCHGEHTPATQDLSSYRPKSPGS